MGNRASAKKSQVPPPPQPSKRSSRLGPENGANMTALGTGAIADRVKGALYGLLIADAMAAPTHWFYGGPNQVMATYGSLIKGYTKPVEHLPGSIMSKSNTGGGGRGGYKGDVIGKIIFHGKKDYWRPGADYHYHNLLQAGDSTLEGLLVRRVMAVTAEQKGVFNEQAITDDYIRFMTTPDSHNDTYCGTCHRMYFANYASGKTPKDCPDNDKHNVDTVDSLVVPSVAALIAVDDQEAAEMAARMVSITRNSPTSSRYARKWAQALRAVVKGATVHETVQGLDKSVGLAVERAGRRQDPLTACYLDSAFPAALFMAFKYAPSRSSDSKGEAFRKGVLANASRGGENVGSGALLGALWGAEIGFSALPGDLVKGLAVSQHEQLAKEIDAFVETVPFLREEAQCEESSSL